MDDLSGDRYQSVSFLLIFKRIKMFELTPQIYGCFIPIDLHATFTDLGFDVMPSFGHSRKLKGGPYIANRVPATVPPQTARNRAFVESGSGQVLLVLSSIFPINKLLAQD